MIASGLLDGMMARRAWGGQMTDEPAVTRPDNLFEPVASNYESYSRFCGFRKVPRNNRLRLLCAGYRRSGRCRARRRLGGVRNIPGELTTGAGAESSAISNRKQTAISTGNAEGRRPERSGKMQGNTRLEGASRAPDRRVPVLSSICSQTAVLETTSMTGSGTARVTDLCR